MTLFEILIISCIYIFCYGYVLAVFVEEENVWIRLALMIASLGFALFVPLFIGGAVFKKLNNKWS